MLKRCVCFFSSRRRHTRCLSDWSSDVCSSDLLGITPDVYDAIVFCRESLALAARPRLSEEILRLLREGRSRRAIYMAWETGVLDVLLPELSALVYDAEEEGSAGQRLWRLLDHIDKRTAEEGPLDDTVLWTLLLLEPMKEACEGVRDRSGAV